MIKTIIEATAEGLVNIAFIAVPALIAFTISAHQEGKSLKEWMQEDED